MFFVTVKDHYAILLLRISILYFLITISAFPNPNFYLYIRLSHFHFSVRLSYCRNFVFDFSMSSSLFLIPYFWNVFPDFLFRIPIFSLRYSESHVSIAVFLFQQYYYWFPYSILENSLLYSNFDFYFPYFHFTYSYCDFRFFETHFPIFNYDFHILNPLISYYYFNFQFLQNPIYQFKKKINFLFYYCWNINYVYRALPYPDVASLYHQLVMVYQDEGKLEQAEEMFR